MAGDPFLSEGKRRTKKLSAIKRKKPRYDSDEDMSISETENPSVEEEEDDEEDGDSEGELDETAADKRRRLAKQYLENLKQEVGEGFDAKDLDDEIISRRLKEDVAETKGQVYRFIADSLLLADVKPTVSRVGSKSLTSIAVRFPYAYTVSKDIELVKWDIRDFTKKPVRVRHTRGGKRFTEVSNDPVKNGHSDELLTVAASPDGRFVVTGGRDKRLVVWSAESLACQRVLETKDRRGVVLGAVFRRGSDQLYAACADLKVRTYAVTQGAQLEVLYGHQDEVVDVAALGQERCVTVGARDRCAMLWKIADETRLTFRGGENERKKKDESEDHFYAEGSIDCVSMLDDTYFVTGSDNGSISLWSLAKKKPLFIQHTAHGVLPPTPAELASAEQDPELRQQQVPQPRPYWITAIHAVPYSNVFFSGSWNGAIKVWKLEDNLRSFTLLGELPNARGIVSRIDVAESGAHGKESLRVLAAMSKEHRLGRWVNNTKGRNHVYSAVIDQQVLR